MRDMLDIIIVNWNTGHRLRDCLESIAAANRQGFDLRRVVVVDNASTDGSVEGLDDLPLPLTIIKNSTNRGFAAACNQGATGSEADYLLFLNPDTILFENSLSIPIDFMEQPENQQAGICGIQLVDEEGIVARTCARFPLLRMFFVKMLGLDKLAPSIFQSHFLLKWDHADTRQVDHVMGAFFFIRRSIFEKLGGFDERFFVYLEDVDLSFRVRQAGWYTCYLAEAQAYHEGGGTSQQVKALRLFYSLRSRILYGYKHFSWWSATALMLGTLLLEPFARLVLAALNRSRIQAEETLKGYAMLWRATPELFRSVMGGDR